MGRFWKEVGEMLDHKVAQGAAELSQALNSQSNRPVRNGDPYGVFRPSTRSRRGRA